MRPLSSGRMRPWRSNGVCEPSAQLRKSTTRTAFDEYNEYGTIRCQHRETNMSQSTPDVALAFEIFECLKTGDLPTLLSLLDNPLSLAAVQCENSFCLRKACDTNREDFVRALLPYCRPQDMGAALYSCLAKGALALFDLIVQHDPTSAQFMELDTLRVLAVRHHYACQQNQADEEQESRAALGRFLDWVPQDTVDKCLYQMQGTPRNALIVEHIQNVLAHRLAQQQKERLEQNIQARGETTKTSTVQRKI